MDRSLPEIIIRSRKKKVYIRIGISLATIVVLMVLIRSFTLVSVNINNVMVSEADRGDMVVTFSATGKVVPVYEEALISPVSSRIMRILCQPGQRVEKGQKLLEIDINNQNYELGRLQSVYDQTRNNHTRLGLEILKKEENGNLQHNLLQKKIESLRVEVEQEQYLLSIGGSSPDRLAKLKMELSTAELEFESSKKQLNYDQEITKLELQSLQIDLSIHENRLNEIKALLARAQMESPVSGTVSFLLDQPGASIGVGEVAARISDLSAFRIEAVAGESYTSQLLSGQQALIRVGREELKGTVANIAPSVTEGVVNFGVLPEDPSNPALRSNMRVEIRIISQKLENTVRIKTGEFYKGPGKYDLFVVNGGTAYKRNISLGGASFTHIEVINGLNAGEKVITSNMKNFEKLEKIGVRD
jgi:HlyD family secretion protein